MFTFKTKKPTGRWRSFNSSSHYVKIKKIAVGRIDDDIPFKIWLRVIKDDIMEDGNANCEWKWIRLKKESKSLEEAKLFLRDNYGVIIEKYNLVKED
jgi:hypothetical protein